MAKEEETKETTATSSTSNNNKDDDDFEEHKATVTSWWESRVCRPLESKGGVYKVTSRQFLRRIVIDAPVVSFFCLMSMAVYFVLHLILRLGPFLGVVGLSNTSTKNPLLYIRLVTNIISHSSLRQLKNNMVQFLMVGPSVEHALGSRTLIKIILVVAITSGLAHLFIFGGRAKSSSNNQHVLLGASGLVFCVILLNSLVSAQRGKIPLYFVLTALLWMSDELYYLIIPDKNNTHHLAHVVGAIVGTMTGLYWYRQGQVKKVKHIARAWKASASSSKTNDDDKKSK